MRPAHIRAASCRFPNAIWFCFVLLCFALFNLVLPGLGQRFRRPADAPDVRTEDDDEDEHEHDLGRCLSRVQGEGNPEREMWNAPL